MLVRSNTEPFIARRVLGHNLRGIGRANTYIVNVPSGSAIGLSSRRKCMGRAPGEGYI